MNAKRFIILILGLVIACVGFYQPATAQDITPEDLKQLREIIAERDFYKAKAEVEQKLKKHWIGIAADWEELAAKERDRADRVQGGRIKDLERALAASKIESAVLRNQITRDQVYIKKLERRINSLKTQRLLFGAVGFVAGTAFGSRIKF